MQEALAFLITLATSPLGLVGETWLLTYLVKHQVFMRLGFKDQSSVGIKCVAWGLALILNVAAFLAQHKSLIINDLLTVAGPLAMTLMTAMTAQWAHDHGSAMLAK